jgi:hypothetical protein
MNSQKLKDEYFKFLSQDDTQSFIFTFAGFSALLIGGYIDLDAYTKIMMVATGAFYGQKLTN